MIIFFPLYLLMDLVAAWALLQLWQVGAALQLWCAGFSLQRPVSEHEVWGLRASVGVVHGLNGRGSWALEHRLSSCGAQA